MLKQLDTLVALVVIMAGVSLLITPMTQMISALLGLREKNLAALSTLLAVRMLRIESRWTIQSQACMGTPINAF